MNMQQNQPIQQTSLQMSQNIRSNSMHNITKVVEPQGMSSKKQASIPPPIKLVNEQYSQNSNKKSAQIGVGYDQVGRLLKQNSITSTNTKGLISPNNGSIYNSLPKFKNAINIGISQHTTNQNSNQLNGSNGYQYKQNHTYHQSYTQPLPSMTSLSTNHKIADFTRPSFPHSLDQNLNGIKLNPQAKENDFFTYPSFASSTKNSQQQQQQQQSQTIINPQNISTIATNPQKHIIYLDSQQNQTIQQSENKTEYKTIKNQILTLNQNFQNLISTPQHSQGQNLQISQQYQSLPNPQQYQSLPIPQQYQSILTPQQCILTPQHRHQSPQQRLTISSERISTEQNQCNNNDNVQGDQVKNEAMQFVSNRDLETELKDIVQLLKLERDEDLSFTNDLLQIEVDSQNQEMKEEVEQLKQKNDILNKRVEQMRCFTVEYDKEQQLVLLEKNLAIKKLCDENDHLCVRYSQLERVYQQLQDDFQSHNNKNNIILDDLKDQQTNLAQSTSFYQSLERKVSQYEDQMREDDIQINKTKQVVFKQEENIKVLENMLKLANEEQINIQYQFIEEQTIRKQKEKELSQLNDRFEAQQQEISAQKKQIDVIKADLDNYLNEEINHKQKGHLKIIEENQIQSQQIENNLKLEEIVLKLENDILEKESIIKQINSQILQKEREIQSNKTKLESKDEEIKERNQEINERDNEIRQYLVEIGLRKQEIITNQQEMIQQQQDINQKQQVINQQQQEMQQKQDIINQQVQELDNKQAEIDKLKRDTIVLSQNTIGLSIKIASLQAALEESIEKLNVQQYSLQEQTELQQEISQFTENNKELNDQLIRLNSIIENTTVDFELQTKEIIKEKNEAIERGDSYIEEVCTLKRQINLQKITQDEQASLIQDLTSHKLSLHTDLDQLTQHKIILLQTQEKLSNQIKELTNQNKELGYQNKELASQNNELANENKELTSQNNDLANENKEVKRELIENDKEVCEKVNKKILQQQEEILQLIGDNKSIVEEKEALTDKIRELQQTNIDSLTSLHSAQNTINSLTVQLSTQHHLFSQDNISLQSQINQFTLSHKQYQIQLDKFRSDILFQTDLIHTKEIQNFKLENSISELIQKNHFDQESKRLQYDERIKKIEEEKQSYSEKYQNVSSNLNNLEEKLNNIIEQLNEKREQEQVLVSRNQALMKERDCLELENKEISRLIKELRDTQKKVAQLQESLNESQRQAESQKEEMLQMNKVNSEKLEDKERIGEEYKDKVRCLALELVQKQCIIDDLSHEVQSEQDNKQIIQNLRKQKETAELEQIKLLKDNKILRLNLIEKQPESCMLEQALKEHNDILSMYHSEIQRLKEKLQSKQMVVDKLTNKSKKGQKLCCDEQRQIHQLQQLIELGKINYEKIIQEQSIKIGKIQRQQSSECISLNNQINQLKSDKQQLKQHLDSIQQEMQQVVQIQQKINTIPSNQLQQ